MKKGRAMITIKKIELENFKGSKHNGIELSQFNVITGLNSAGKTSVLQALVFLKQSLSRKEVVYNDYLLNSGDFREVLHAHEGDSFSITVTFSIDESKVVYAVTIYEDRTVEEFFVNDKLEWQWDSKAPYAMEPAGRMFLKQASEGFGGGQYAHEDLDRIAQVQQFQKTVVDWFEEMLYLSSHRGFTKYSYPMLAGSPSLDEVAKRAGDATLMEEWLANLIMYRVNEAKRYSKSKDQLDLMSERLSRVGVDINTYVLAGPSVVVDLTENDMWVSAVNSGYGINQLVASIALGTLMPKDTLIMVEEPEIHLHPKLQRIVCEMFVEMANEGKQVLITSHSDHFLKTLADADKKSVLPASKIRVYNFKKEGRATVSSPVDISDTEAIEKLFN